MPTANKTIKIEIKVKDDKKVSVSKAVEIFQKIQDIVYNIGDHLHGNIPRPSGDYPSYVKKEFCLVFKDIKMGSLSAELQISDLQAGLPDLKTYGERALDNTNDILETIIVEEQPQDKLVKIIDNPKRLDRILRDLDPIWPEEISDYTISYTYKQASRYFSPEKKSIIKAMLHSPVKKIRETIQGRLYDFRVDQNRIIQIDTPEGTRRVKYLPEMESYLKQHIGEVVEIIGETIIENGKELFYLQSENDLTKKNTLDVSNIKLKDKSIFFKKPIQVETEFENEQYILSNDKLNLLVVSPKIKDGLKEINEELITIWREYVFVNESELSEDAKKFKQYLLSLVQEGN